MAESIVERLVVIWHDIKNHAGDGLSELRLALDGIDRGPYPAGRQFRVLLETFLDELEARGRIERITEADEDTDTLRRFAEALADPAAEGDESFRAALRRTAELYLNMHVDTLAQGREGRGDADALLARKLGDAKAATGATGTTRKSLLAAATARVMTMLSGRAFVVCDGALAFDDVWREERDDLPVLVLVAHQPPCDGIARLIRLREQGGRNPALVLTWDDPEDSRRRFRVLQFGRSFHALVRCPLELARALDACAGLTPVTDGNLAELRSEIRLAREPVLREVDDILGPLESAPVEAGAAADRLMELRDRLQNETNMAMHMPASPEGDDDTPLGRAMRDAIRDLKDAAGDAGKIERIAGRLRRLFERWRGIVTYETLE